MRRLIYFLFILVVCRAGHCEEVLQGEPQTLEQAAPVVYGKIGAENLHHAFSEHIKILSDHSNLIGYLEFKEDHPIDEATYLYVKYALNYFKKKNVAFVIAHLNTFGGEIFPAIKIADLFQKLDINDGIPLIAFIDKHAIASGVILAYACRFIAVTNGALMGGQVPDQIIKVQSIPEKMMAYLLNEYASLASFYGRDPVAAEAMVDIKIIAVDRGGQIVRFYDSSEGVDSDVVLATNNEWLTFNADQLLKYGIADFGITLDTQFYPSNGEKSKGYWLFDKSLLSKEPYLSSIPNATVIAYESWKISFLMFLTHPLVTAILLVAVILCFYVQVKTGKFNTVGALGLICLILTILASFSIQAISWIEVVLLALGVTLVILDSLLEREGGNSIGFLGIALTVASLIMLLLPGFEKFSLLDFESYSFAARSLIERTLWLIGALVVAFIAILVIRGLYSHKFRKIPQHLPEIKEFIKEKDFLETFEEGELPKEGSQGIAHCTLRPFGKVVIHDKIYDAISHDNKTILKKSPIVVVKHEHGKLIIRQKN